MQTVQQTLSFRVITCGNCGVPFGLEKSMYERLVNEKTSFYCPNGHCRQFVVESDADKAQRLAGKLDMERTRRQQVEAKLDYAIRARKAVSTRLRKVKQRVGHGVCPCCNRTFKQLARHMEAKHPNHKDFKRKLP